LRTDDGRPVGEVVVEKRRKPLGEDVSIASRVTGWQYHLQERPATHAARTNLDRSPSRINHCVGRVGARPRAKVQSRERLRTRARAATAEC